MTKIKKNVQSKRDYIKKSILIKKNFEKTAKKQLSHNGLASLLAERGKNSTREFLHGDVSTRIVGGEAGDINNIPYIVALIVTKLKIPFSRQAR